MERSKLDEQFLQMIANHTRKTSSEYMVFYKEGGMECDKKEKQIIGYLVSDERKLHGTHVFRNDDGLYFIPHEWIVYMKPHYRERPRF